MSFLEQLEQEARKQREQESRRAMERQERELFFQEVAEPTFRQLFDYLKRLTEHLNYLGKRLETRYRAPGYGVLKGHMNDDLKVRFGSNEQGLTIDVSGTVSVPRQHVYSAAGEAEVRRLRGFARERGLHTNERIQRNSRGQIVGGQFQLSGTVTLRVIASTGIDDPEFRITFTNVADFGQMLKVVPPEQMDEALMDKLGRFIARVDDDFLLEPIDDAIREELARRLSSERVHRVHDLAEHPRRERSQLERHQEAQKLSERFQDRLDAIKRKLAER